MVDPGFLIVGVDLVGGGCGLLRGCQSPQVKVRVKVKVKSWLLGLMQKSAPITVVRFPRNMIDL